MAEPKLFSLLAKGPGATSAVPRRKAAPMDDVMRNLVDREIKLRQDREALDADASKAREAIETATREMKSMLATELSAFRASCQGIAQEQTAAMQKAVSDAVAAMPAAKQSEAPAVDLKPLIAEWKDGLKKLTERVDAISKVTPAAPVVKNAGWVIDVRRGGDDLARQLIVTPKK